VARGDSFWTSTVYEQGVESHLVAREYRWNGSSYVAEPTEKWSIGPAYNSLDVEVGLDSNDNVWAWSVGANVVHVLHGDGLLGGDEGEQYTLASSTIFIDNADDPSVGVATSCDASGCTTLEYSAGVLAPAASQPWAAEQAVVANEHDGTRVLVDATQGVVVDDGSQSTILHATDQVLYADASEAADGTLYVAAVVDSGSSVDVQLSYGVMGAVFTSETFALDPALDPEGVSVHATQDRVAIAVSAVDGSGNDAVGWAFLSPL